MIIREHPFPVHTYEVEIDGHTVPCHCYLRGSEWQAYLATSQRSVLGRGLTAYAATENAGKAYLESMAQSQLQSKPKQSMTLDELEI